MTEETPHTEFRGWAAVEIMGHQKEVGFVETTYFGPSCMFRIDIPDLPARQASIEAPRWLDGRLLPPGSKIEYPALEGRTRYVGVSAIFSLTPITEQAAKRMLDSLHPRAAKIIDVPDEAKALEAAADVQDEDWEPEDNWDTPK